MPDQFVDSNQSFQNAINTFSQQESAQEAPPQEKPVPPAETAPETAAPQEAAPQEPTEETPTEESEVKPLTAEEKYVPMKRFNEVYRKLKTVERQLQSVQQAPPVQQPVQPQTQTDSGLPQFPEPLPQLGDFKDYDEFVRASVKWELKKERFETETRQQVEQIRAQQFQRQQFENAKMREGATKYEDWFDVTGELSQYVSPQATPVIYQALFTSDIFPDLVHRLGTNPTELNRILQIRDFNEQIYEVKALEKKIKQEQIDLKRKETQKAPQVEKPGQGIPKARPNTTKLYEKAAKSGSDDDWAKYIDEAGI